MGNKTSNVVTPKPIIFRVDVRGRVIEDGKVIFSFGIDKNLLALQEDTILLAESLTNEVSLYELKTGKKIDRMYLPYSRDVYTYYSYKDSYYYMGNNAPYKIYIKDNRIKLLILKKMKYDYSVDFCYIKDDRHGVLIEDKCFDLEDVAGYYLSGKFLYKYVSKENSFTIRKFDVDSRSEISVIEDIDPLFNMPLMQYLFDPYSEPEYVYNERQILYPNLLGKVDIISEKISSVLDITNEKQYNNNFYLVTNDTRYIVQGIFFSNSLMYKADVGKGVRKSIAKLGSLDHGDKIYVLTKREDYIFEIQRGITLIFPTPAFPLPICRIIFEYFV